ncbi:MAG: RNA polymerase sigma factor [Planctomycetota bacterium]
MGSRRDDPTADEAALVEAARRGDARAFEALYRAHRDWVFALAHRLSGNGEDALDVVQETFFYLARRLPTLELRCRLKTFLYPAVKHLALARRERRRRESPLEEAPEPPARDPPPDDSRAVGELDVRHLLRRLPEALYEVVWLRFVDGLSLSEIATALEIPLGTVKSRLHAALEALRRRGRPSE